MPSCIATSFSVLKRGDLQHGQLLVFHTTLPSSPRPGLWQNPGADVQSHNYSEKIIINTNQSIPVVIDILSTWVILNYIQKGEVSNTNLALVLTKEKKVLAFSFFLDYTPNKDMNGMAKILYECKEKVPLSKQFVV